MENDSTKRLYEVGYLLMPLIPEDKLADEVNVLRSHIESAGGLITTEEQPKTRHLGYDIRQRGIVSKKLRFEEAYFGWMRFQASGTEVLAITDAFDKNDKILRSLIIKPVKDVPRVPRMNIVSKPKTEAIKKDKKSTMSDTELDKEIDQLLDDNKVPA